MSNGYEALRRIARAAFMAPTIYFYLCQSDGTTCKTWDPRGAKQKKTLLRMSKRPGLHWNRLT